jgi:hypothetical protein
LADSTIMGLGKPAGVAFANAAKLVVLVTLVPAVLHNGGYLTAVWTFAAAEVARYAVLTLVQRQCGLAFLRQDLATTALFLASILALRSSLAVLGLTGGVADLLGIPGAILG